MDPLSISAGIIAVLGLSTTVVKYLADLRDASDSSKKLIVEISLTRGILSTVQVLTESATQELLKEPLEECITTLRQLETKLAHSDERRKKIAQALKWPFKKTEIDEILQKLERQKSLFELALQNDHRALSLAIKNQQDELKNQVERISSGVTELQEGQQDQERHSAEQKRQETLDWLSSLRFERKQNDVYSQRRSGTGKWFLEHQQFKRWLEGELRTLWCPGIAGAGKTVISAIAIDHLQSQFNNAQIGIAWIYFDYRERDQQSTAGLIGSLVQQLARQRSFISAELEALYDEHTGKHSSPDLSDYSKLLHEETRNYIKTFIVVDALDECTESGGTRRDFIAELRRLQPRVQILVTSRPLPGIGQLLHDPPQLEIRAAKQDIRNYMESQLWAEDQLKHNLERDPTLLEAILRTVDAKAQGMFLLARLYVTSLAQYDNPRRLRNALDSLPEEYPAVYDQVMQRIHAQAPAQKKRPLQVLSWLAYSRAPLKASALQHALAVEPGDNDLTEDALTDLDRLLSVCLGLVVIDNESHEIRFVHYTTQEYFKNDRTKVLPDGQRNITLTCLNYLSLDEFSHGGWNTKSELETRKARYPFFEYAAKNWGHHARGQTEKVLQDQITTFLKHDGRRLCAHQCWNKYYHDHALNVAAAFGLANIVDVLISQGASVSERNERDRQALHRAAEEGDFDDVINILLDHGADVNARRESGWTPLHEAAKFGHDKTIRVLLDRGADVLTHNIHAAPPLHEAVLYQHLSSISILLDNGADVTGEHPSKSYVSPLHLAACFGYEDTMRLLLERGADVHQRDVEGRTALHRAADHGQLGTTKILIDANSDISSKDQWGRTPLENAARARHAEVTRLILETTTQRLEGYSALTPLHHAAQHGQLEVVEVLLEQGAEMKWKDEQGRNPLRLAQQHRHTEVARILQEHATRRLEDALECF